MTTKQQKHLVRITIAAMLLVMLSFLPHTTALPLWDFEHGLLYYLLVYLLIGYDILRKAGYGFMRQRIFDENFLMTVATIGAFALAIYSDSGDFLEGIAVMLFYQIGEFFQTYAVGKSRRSISALMDIRPDYANVEDGEGRLTRVDPDEVETGQIIVVGPGERIPIDGIITSGTSTIDTAALTGESIPRGAKVGDAVISGSINMTGVLKIETTCPADESTVSRILELVEDSACNKSRSEAFIARFARYYTPFVCFSALALALLPPLALTISGTAPIWSTWIYRALIFLVISCPCALVISIPLTFFAGIGGISREGVLVKGANTLEDLGNIGCIAFDKTGTLTQGVFKVTSICGADGTPLDTVGQNRLLYLAAHAESASSHPIAQGLREAYGQPLHREVVSDIQEVGGQGIIARIDSTVVHIGSARLMAAAGIDTPSLAVSGTTILVAADHRYLGHIIMGDVIKPQSQQAIDDLHHLGIDRSIMLTGDAEAVAKAVATTLHIDEYRAELLPVDKVKAIEALMAEGAGGKKVAFVGDGINDAPVLMRADIGIAMGGIGSDAAIEAADVVLMDDNPRSIARAIRHAQKVVGITRQNIVLALSTKAACLFLGSIGMANMWLAIFADVGIMVLAVLNAMRALVRHRE